MFTTAVKHLGTKPKPAMKALEPRFRPEQNQTITRAIFEILKEHGPLSVAQTWERVQEVGIKDLTSKTQMKTVLRWMKQRQKLKQICNHVGPNKQFLYTTWFTKPPTVTGVKSSST
ncbi:putative ASXL, HARE-HTH domain-containing protein [Helianthus debilis subsp. tardiflorus]